MSGNPPPPSFEVTGAKNSVARTLPLHAAWFNTSELFTRCPPTKIWNVIAGSLRVFEWWMCEVRAALGIAEWKMPGRKGAKISRHPRCPDGSTTQT